MTLLEVKKLSVILRGTQQRLLDDVDLTVDRGEICALVGESGSGKSLTALSILRLLPDALEISGGDVILNNASLFALPESSMNTVRGKKVAMIFQEPQTSLNPVQTVGQQIAEVFQQHHAMTYAQCRHKVLELLREVGIPDPEQRLAWYPHQMSGGQKQRVMIAMALAGEPDLLIADEPTTALDVTIQKQILDLLKGLCQKRQLALLLITHDLGIVSEMADTVCVMQAGKILERQAKEKFFSAPQHDYSKHLLAFLSQKKQGLEPVQQNPLLSLKNLKVWFPVRRGILKRIHHYTKAVDGIDLEIHSGETVALVGESGCGKTTIGKALLRLIPLHEGSMTFTRDQHSQRIDQLDRKAFASYRRDIQIVFQDPFSSMNPRMTVREIIEEGMIHLLPALDALQRRLQLEGLLEKVGLLPEHLHRYPHEFSGGQRQRIAIARALAVQPKLLICDEPTSALDVSIREQILLLLKNLQETEGLAYLFITHDLSLVPRIAHRVAVMKEGIIVEQGITEQVMKHPRQAYTKQLLEAIPHVI